ncbi:hypothetical protein HMI54_002646 [Coelomomyces lativittatus]|nr:hypothetical protein HMI54_002646 [Coelomomyces lativittatus]KAJ1509978.1 hypothetical protein HMI56_006555 [Coelomomyces lativittatus]
MSSIPSSSTHSHSNFKEKNPSPSSNFNIDNHSGSLPLIDPSQFQFLSYFQSFLDILHSQTLPLTHIPPLIFELESKFQTALSFIDSLPDQKISLNDQRSKLKKQLEQLEQRRQSFQQYQEWISKKMTSFPIEENEK